MEEILTRSAKETQKFGAKIAKSLIHGGVIALYGNLGTGKTTFVQGMGKELGIKSNIISPTFIIIKNYSLSDQAFYHIDLYRINNEKDIYSLGLTEILNNPQNIVVIEWPEKIEHLLPIKHTKISFEIKDENSRKLTITRSE